MKAREILEELIQEVANECLSQHSTPSGKSIDKIIDIDKALSQLREELGKKLVILFIMKFGEIDEDLGYNLSLKKAISIINSFFKE